MLQITLQNSVDRLWASAQRYRCPFSILYEFDQWWEWKYRQHHLKQKSGRIIVDMLWPDRERIEKYKQRETPFRVRMDYGVKIHNPRGVIYGSVDV